jgi:hypothetical protein
MGICKLLIMRSKGIFLSLYFSLAQGTAGTSAENGENQLFCYGFPWERKKKCPKD